MHFFVYDAASLEERKGPGFDAPGRDLQRTSIGTSFCDSVGAASGAECGELTSGDDVLQRSLDAIPAVKVHTLILINSVPISVCIPHNYILELFIIVLSRVKF